jgi:signal transduction histidine kinase
LIRASLYDPDMNIEQKRARARKYYAFLDTLSLKPVYLNSTEFRSFLDYYLEYINRIVTGKDVPYDQNEKSSYLAKAIFDDELLKTFLFKRVGSQMDEPGFYKHRASQYTGFMEQFPNTPEAYRLRMIHKKRYPVSNGQPAPDLVLVDSLGRHTRLSHLKGKVVILTTYYPWQRKDPDLEERIEELRQAIGPDLVLVALGRRENGNRVFFHPLVDYYVNANSENRNLTLYEFPSSQSYSFIIRKNGIIEDCIYLLNISDQTINALKSEKYTLLTRLNNFGQEHTTEIIIILSLLFSMTLIFFLQSRLKARHQALMRKQLNSELKAIRSQLNPHFLFNSLNSLQNFINQSDTKTANLHLTKFSRLMRRIIELSEQESIPLQEELELNRTFIELEQLRYGFKCTFDIEEGIDLFNVEIPSMIIQPFIENAIVHAMAELGEQGELKIIVKEQGTDKIKVEILDNGKGFRAEGKHGFGLRSSRERIDLINSQSREKIDLYIESPSDKNAKKGTAVTLIIPKRI